MGIQMGGLKFTLSIPGGSVAIPITNKRLELDALLDVISGGSIPFVATDKALLQGTASLSTGVNHFSLEAWIQPTTVNTVQTLVATGASSDAEAGIWWRLDSTAVKLSIGNGTNRVTATWAAGLVLGTIYHLVITATRNGNAILYVNGVATGGAQDISGGSAYNATGAINLAVAGHPTSASYLNGTLQIVRYWERVLTSGEATVLYNLGNPVLHDSLTAAQKVSLVASYNLNDLTATKYDVQGTNNLSLVATTMVVNGTFDDANGTRPPTGWLNHASHTWTTCDVQSNKMRLLHSGVAANHAAYQQVFLTANRSYSVVYSVVRVAGTLRIEYNTDPRGTNGTVNAGYSTGYLSSTPTNPVTATFTATASNGYLVFNGANASDEWTVDNVSLVLAALPLANGFASAMASDSSGAAKHGSLVGFSESEQILSWIERSGSEGYAFRVPGVDEYVAFGSIGNVTAISLDVRFVADDQEILTLANSQATAVTVAAGVLTFGASLAASAITVDGISKTANEAGVLLNDNAWHTLAFTLTSISATNFRLGSNGVGFGDIEVDNLLVNAGALLNVDFDDGPQGTPSDGNPVLNWIDQENSFQFPQGTIASAPSYTSNALNGKPGVTFNGVSSRLIRTLANTPDVIASDKGTVTLIGKHGSGAFAADAVIMSCSDTGTDTTYWEVGRDTAGKFYVEWRNAGAAVRVTGNTALSPGDDYVMTVCSTGSAFTLTVNRVVQTLTGTNTTGTMPVDLALNDNTVFGGKINSQATLQRPYAGTLCKVLTYEDEQTPAVIDRIQRLSMATYGIS